MVWEGRHISGAFYTTIFPESLISFLLNVFSFTFLFQNFLLCSKCQIKILVIGNGFVLTCFKKMLLGFCLSNVHQWGWDQKLWELPVNFRSRGKWDVHVKMVHYIVHDYGIDLTRLYWDWDCLVSPTESSHLFCEIRSSVQLRDEEDKTSGWGAHVRARTHTISGNRGGRKEKYKCDVGVSTMKFTP